MAYRPTPQRVIERALSHIEVVGECWHSTYSISRSSNRRSAIGYPQIGWQDDGNRYMRHIHRVAWESANGLIPDGMTVDHIHSICPGPPCVRPSHLRLLTNFENARRTNGRDWPLGFCAKGHPNSELRRIGKQMMCQECKKEWSRLSGLKLTAKRRAAKALAS